MIDFEKRFPWMDWREPMPARTDSNGTKRFACPICFGSFAFNDGGSPGPPMTYEEAVDHIAKTHPKP
jgi:hypothetical protein